jgi:23S rRNA (adenine2030-N6)-methyltransferase
MNYRHAYHAGGFADVVKHAALVLLLSHLTKKETPFQVIDLHAGIGRYDLTGDEARKTGESQGGIVKLLTGGALPPQLAGYVAALQSVNPDWPRLRFYPGSPRIARTLLRPNDHLTLVELHPEEGLRLRSEFSRDSQVTIHQEEGYGAMKALLPPRERRGLVFIDPPFEVPDEFRRMIGAVQGGLRRWPTGIFALWYPIKAPEFVSRFLGEVIQFGRPCLAAELLRTPPDDPARLNGSGLVVINPPWQLDRGLEELLPFLHQRLEACGGTRVWMLAPA